MPAAPAAVSRCPIIDLIEPTAHWPRDHRVPFQRALRLASSVRSPRGVPAPWHSIWSTSEGDHPGRRVGRSHGPDLAFGVGGQEVAAHVVGQADAADDAVDRVPVVQGVVQPLQHQDPRPFAHDEAVGPGIEGGAPARGGKGPELAETDLGVEAVGAGDAAGQNRVQASCAEGVAGELDGIDGGGAGRIEGIAAAAQPQGTGQEGAGEAGDAGGQAPVSGESCRRRGNGIREIFPEPSPRDVPAQDLHGDAGGRIRGQGDGRQDHAGAGALELRVARSIGKGRMAGPEDQMVEGIEIRRQRADRCPRPPGRERRAPPGRPASTGPCPAAGRGATTWSFDTDQRPSGTSRIDSTPRAMLRQKASRSGASGNTPPIPTTAMGFLSVIKGYAVL